MVLDRIQIARLRAQGCAWKKIAARLGVERRGTAMQHARKPADMIRLKEKTAMEDSLCRMRLSS